MFRLEIKTDNAAFQPDASQELAEILLAIAEQVTRRQNHRGGSGTCYDSNGNRVGHWNLELAEVDQEEEV